MPKDLAERVVMIEETAFARLSSPPTDRERELVRAIAVALLADAEVSQES